MYIVLKPHISVFQFFFIVDFWHQKVFGNYHYKNTVDVFTYKSQWYSLSHVIVFYHFLLIFLRYLHITVNEKPLNQYMANILRFFSFTRSLLIPEKIHRNKSTLLKRFYNGKKNDIFCPIGIFRDFSHNFSKLSYGLLIVYWNLRR